MAEPTNSKPLRAVWSLWTKPLTQSSRAGWLSPKHHLLSWLLSFESARRFYPETHLVTDDEGARTLIDGLGLEFEHVSTALNALARHDPDWWVLGKLHAYRHQDAPFVHIDSDVFLWEPLPERVASAAVFAQNPEHFGPCAAPDPPELITPYRPELIERALTADARGWLPEEWVWFRRARPDRQRGECCGVFGGTRTDFVRHYAETALRLAHDPANESGWARVRDMVDSTVDVEQYTLAACVEYHAARPESPFAGVRIAYLFDSAAAAYEPYSASYPGNTHLFGRAEQEAIIADHPGYTHLIGRSKQDAAIADRLERRVRRDYPEQYERCLALVHDAEARLAQAT